MKSDLKIEQITPELTWNIRNEAMYPNHPIEAVKLEDDFSGVHFGIFADNSLAGVVSVFEDGDTMVFRKLAVRPDFQNQKIGTKLLQYVIDYATENHKKQLRCNARVSAINFYKKFGFATNGNTFSKNGIDFMTIEKEI